MRCSRSTSRGACPRRTTARSWARRTARRTTTPSPTPSRAAATGPTTVTLEQDGNESQEQADQFSQNWQSMLERLQGLCREVLSRKDAPARDTGMPPGSAGRHTCACGLARRASLASRLIGTALSAWLTGQFALASSAAAWKSSAEMPGTSPTTGQLDLGDARAGHEGDARPSCRGWSGACRPWRGRWRTPSRSSDECAAAMSSSGLVLPLACSARDGQVTS